MAWFSIACYYLVFLAGYCPNQDMEVAVPRLAIFLLWRPLIEEEIIIAGEDIIQSKTDIPFQHIRLAAMKTSFDKLLF